MADENPFEKSKRPLAMTIMGLAMQLGKRIGLAKPMLTASMGRMFDADKMARAFHGYEPTEHDVFVATFGKSGTNWMMQISQQIAHYGAAEFDHIHERVPWPDGPSGPVGDIHDSRFAEESPTGLRVIKTHLPTEHVPYDEAAAYLTVIRDPKEVMVSAYYFLCGVLGVLDYLTFDDWYEITMDSDRLVDNWATHTASFWEWRERANVLVVSYSEIIKEPVASIELVAKTMGVELTAEQLDAVVERSSFPYMKVHESQFAPPPPPFSRNGERAKMIRSGKTGGSDEALSVEQQMEIDQRCIAELGKLGSDFPYTTAFTQAGG